MKRIKVIRLTFEEIEIETDTNNINLIEEDIGSRIINSHDIEDVIERCNYDYILDETGYCQYNK